MGCGSSGTEFAYQVQKPEFKFQYSKKSKREYMRTATQIAIEVIMMC
jgi:hypothetical protein